MWKQAHDSERGDRFARAGFADQAEDFSGSDSEVEITDRRHGSRGKNRPASVTGWQEFYVQVADFEKRRHAVMLAANSRPAGDGQPRACPEPAEGALSLHKALPVTANESSQSAAASLMLRPMSKIHIPTPLRQYVGKQSTVDVKGATVGEAMSDLLVRHPDLRRHLYADDGKLRAFVNLYVNDEDIRYLQKEATAVKEGDNISIVPSIAGGAV